MYVSEGTSSQETVRCLSGWRSNLLPPGFEDGLGVLEGPVLGLLVPHSARRAEADLELPDHLQGLGTVVQV